MRHLVILALAAMVVCTLGSVRLWEFLVNVIEEVMQ